MFTGSFFGEGGLENTEIDLVKVSMDTFLIMFRWEKYPWIFLPCAFGENFTETRFFAGG